MIERFVRRSFYKGSPFTNDWTTDDSTENKNENLFGLAFTKWKVEMKMKWKWGRYVDAAWWMTPLFKLKMNLLIMS